MDPISWEETTPSIPPPFSSFTQTHFLSLSVFLSASYSVIMEPGSPKKIQFAVPPLQGQLDPQAAEHVSGSVCFKELVMFEDDGGGGGWGGVGGCQRGSCMNGASFLVS